jgi:iron complex outermembrane receptor protein
VVTGSIQNLLDTDPPFAQSFYNYDVTNGNPLGRVFKLGVKKKF